MVDASGATLGTWTYGTGTVLSPTNSLTVENFVTDPGSSSCSAGFDAGQDVYAGPTATGTPLRSTRKTFNFLTVPGYPIYAASPREIKSTTILDDGVTTSSVVKTYGTPTVNFDGISCNSSGTSCTSSPSTPLPIGGAVTETTIGYDGSTMKEVDTAYQWQGNASYFAANLLELPSAQIEKDGS